MDSELCILCSHAKAGVLIIIIIKLKCHNIWSLDVTPHRPA